jgi:predicted Zn-dependent peptidase
MDRKLFTEVNAYIGGDIEPGLFFVTGKPNPEITLEEADEILTAELEKLKTEKIKEYELEKVKNKFESNDLFSNISYLNKASNIAYHELVGNAEDINTEVIRYRAVTPEKIRETAENIFRKENCSTLYYRASRQ